MFCLIYPFVIVFHFVTLNSICREFSVRKEVIIKIVDRNE